MNDLKARLKNGESVLGTMLSTVDNPEIATIFKVCGFDYFIIDCEHGFFDFAKVAAILGMAREADIPAIIRVAEVRREIIQKYMDMGAAGILLAQTESAAQAMELVRYAKYAPMGNRGIALLKPHTGFDAVGPEYRQTANGRTIMIAQIESLAGVDAIDAIMGVDGIDAALVGHNDLTQNMGIYGQFTDPAYLEALDKVIGSARRHGKFSGIGPPIIEELGGWVEKGMTLNLWGNEISIFRNACIEAFRKIGRG